MVQQVEEGAGGGPDVDDHRYRSLFESLADPILVVDLESGLILEATPVTATVHGYAPGELVGRSVGVLSADPARALADLRRGAGPATVEQHVRKDGSRFPAEVVASVVAWGGRPAIVQVVRDVSARVRAEEALRASETRFREILLASPVPLALNDDQHRITYLNPAFVETFGYTSADLRTLDDWWPRAYPDPAYRRQVSEAWMAELARSAAGGGAFTPLEVEVRCKDGTTRTILASAAPLSTPSSREHLVVLFDVTERKRFQGRLAQADRLSAIGVLAAGVAHEINNPLAYVLANLDAVAQDLARLAEEGAGPVRQARLDELVTCVRAASEGVQRIRRISQSLVAFSHVERDGTADVDLNVAIRAAVTMAQNEVRHRARLVEALGALPAVHASEGKLSQVFLNLILNAAHAIEEGHADENRITVRSWAAGGEVFAEVADTGQGIPPENLERIFEPFFTTKRLGAGSGLGLAISRSIVAELGGDLRVESEPGRGSRFTVRLPAGRAQRGPPPEVAAAPAPAPVPVRGRVLVVDDEEQVRRVLVRLLSAQHEVVSAGSGREGRALLERDPGFDVILCDLMMPEMTGMDLHAWLVEHAPALARRVIFLSGGAFTPRASDYVARVGNRQVEKPFDPAQLRALVAALVAEARARG